MRSILALIICFGLAAPSNAFAREDNYNAGAAAAANSTGASNANCNSALVQFCEQVYAEASVSPGDGTSTQSSGKTWETGKAAFPGNDNAREVTVSWQSGRTNAIFSAPGPEVGSSGAIIVALLILVAASRRLRFRHNRNRYLYNVSVPLFFK